MKIAALDIETIPSQDIPEEAIPQFDPDTVKYGNLKDPVKRQVKLEQEHQAFLEGLDKKMSTDFSLCQICTFVGQVYDTSADEVVEETAVHFPSPQETEYEVAYAGINFVLDAITQRIPLVTFNGVGFDLPILRFAGMRQDVPWPYSPFDKVTKKWGSKEHYDLMQCLCNFQFGGFKKLDFYLQLFGLGSKMEGIDGSEVYSNWQAGNHERILEYCRQDVTQTARLFARVEAWIVQR